MARIDTKPPVVLKIGGHEIEDPVFLSSLAGFVHDFDHPLIIVHGGGREISSLQNRLGIEPVYVDGVRKTDAESLALVTMVLAGVVNKRLVRYLLGRGIDALGLSGVDLRLVSAQKMQHDEYDMGFTGEVVSVRAEAIKQILDQKVVPVIAPVCYAADADIDAYNVNADHVAGAVGAAIGAERVVFLTNVSGVLADSRVIPQLSGQQAEDLIVSGVISGGMVPKVRTALQMLEVGVARSVITNLEGLKTHGGTVIVNNSGEKSE